MAHFIHSPLGAEGFRIFQTILKAISIKFNGDHAADVL